MTRLQDIESLIPRESQAIADIGYDHGKLLDRLLLSLPDALLYGVEIQPEAATRYWSNRTNVAAGNRRLCLIHGNGLKPLREIESPPDVAVFAGIGESRIVEILQNSPDVVAGLRRMVFAPEKPRAVLRPYLRSIGWSAVEERLSLDRGRFYQSFAAEDLRRDGQIRESTFEASSVTLSEPGSEPLSRSRSGSGNHPFWLLGPDLFEQNHPLLKPYLRHLQKALGLRSSRDRDGAASERRWLSEYRAAIARALDL